MNFRQASKEQIGLMLHGLRAIYVHDQEDERLKLIERLEAELASRGVRLAA